MAEDLNLGTREKPGHFSGHSFASCTFLGSTEACHGSGSHQVTQVPPPARPPPTPHPRSCVLPAWGWLWPFPLAKSIGLTYLWLASSVSFITCFRLSSIPCIRVWHLYIPGESYFPWLDPDWPKVSGSSCSTEFLGKVHCWKCSYSVFIPKISEDHLKYELPQSLFSLQPFSFS